MIKNPKKYFFQFSFFCRRISKAEKERDSYLTHFPCCWLGGVIFPKMVFPKIVIKASIINTKFGFFKRKLDFFGYFYHFKKSNHMHFILNQTSI
jgi:hypothetical protein